MTTSRSWRDRLFVDQGSGASAAPATLEKAAAYGTAAWCLGFAAVSVWQLVAGLGDDNRFAAYASGLAVMGLLVLVLKLIGAAVAVSAVAPWQERLPRNLLAAALWGGFGMLALYSAGNVVITIGTVFGLLEPSDAWTAAGGVTAKALLYVAFFLAGAVVFGFLAVSFHRRRHPPRTVVLTGLVGAPVLLGLLLLAAPAVLGLLGLLPT